MTAARMIATRVPSHPEAAVLVLHGGASRRAAAMVSPTQLSVLRMIPIATLIAHRGHGRLAVFRVLNSVRGWDHSHTPVNDALWAMEQLRRRFGETLPIGLVGHSLGGRAALLAATEPHVHSVVALNPFVYPMDGGNLHDRRVLIVHGTADRIASPANSAAVARTLARTASVGYINVQGGKHAMLAHHRRFDALAADFVVSTLLNLPADGAIAQVLAGQSPITV